MNLQISSAIDVSLITAAQKLIADHQRFVVTAHMSPDGDALGSVVAMARYLRAKGKEANIVVNDTPGENLAFMPEVDQIIAYDRMTAHATALLQEAEVIVCLDFNLLSRVGEMSKVLMATSARRLLLDHHLGPDREAFDVVISYPEMSATCELVTRFIMQSADDHLLDRVTATALYIGMMTDTGILSYNSDNPEVYMIVARLLQAGIDKEEIHRALNAEKERRIRLKGYVMETKMQVNYPHHAAYFSLSKAEIKKYNHQKGDSEGFVNIPLAIPEVMCSAFFREEQNFVKVSLRSKGNYPVNLMAEKFFNGGGHLNAAGGEFYGSLSQAEQLFQKVLPLFDKYCNNDVENAK